MCCTSSMSLFLSKQKAHLGSILEPKGMYVFKHLKMLALPTLDALLLSCAHVWIRNPARTSLPNAGITWNDQSGEEYPNVSNPVHRVSQNSFGSSSTYLKSPTVTLWVRALLKSICIFSFHQIRLLLAGAVSGHLQTPVLAQVCCQSVNN